MCVPIAKNLQTSFNILRFSWCQKKLVLGLEASDEDPTCSTEREEDIREPERLLVGDVSARKARLAKVKVRFCKRKLSLL